MRKGIGCLAALALFLMPANLAAQREEAQDQRQLRGARNPATMLLENKDRIGLSEEQANRLEQIARQFDEKNGPLLEKLDALRREAPPRPRAGHMSAEERDELRKQWSELREKREPLLDELRTNHRAAGDQIREILTDEQRSRLRRAMGRRMGFRGRRPGPPRLGRGFRPGGRPMMRRPGPRHGAHRWMGHTHRRWDRYWSHRHNRCGPWCWLDE